MTPDEEIEYLRDISGEELTQEVMRRKWYVQPNDLIGGFCIMPINLPPSSGCFEIADFIDKVFAEHIANLHNDWLIENASVDTIISFRLPSFLAIGLRNYANLKNQTVSEVMRRVIAELLQKEGM